MPKAFPVVAVTLGIKMPLAPIKQLTLVPSAHIDAPNSVALPPTVAVNDTEHGVTSCPVVYPPSPVTLVIVNHSFFGVTPNPCAFVVVLAKVMVLAVLTNRGGVFEKLKAPPVSEVIMAPAKLGAAVGKVYWAEPATAATFKVVVPEVAPLSINEPAAVPAWPSVIAPDETVTFALPDTAFVLVA